LVPSCVDILFSVRFDVLTNDVLLINLMNKTQSCYLKLLLDITSSFD